MIRTAITIITLIFVMLLCSCVTTLKIPKYAQFFQGDSYYAEELETGKYLVGIDATSNEKWSYWDIDQDSLVEVAEPKNNKDWDLAFQRFKIKINGGGSGSSGVQITLIKNADFEQVKVTENFLWRKDESIGLNQVKYAFAEEGDWFVYDFFTHMLEPRDQFYLLRSSENIIYKLKMLTYYDRLLISGFPTFQYSLVE